MSPGVPSQVSQAHTSGASGLAPGKTRGEPGASKGVSASVSVTGLWGVQWYVEVGQASEQAVCTNHSSQASRSPLLTLRLCLRSRWGSPQHPWPGLSRPLCWSLSPSPGGGHCGGGQRRQWGEATLGGLRGPGCQFTMARRPGGEGCRPGPGTDPAGALEPEGPPAWGGVDCSQAEPVRRPASTSGCGRPGTAATLGQAGLHV